MARRSQLAPDGAGEEKAMSERMPSGAAVGWITFAGTLMIIGGGLKMLEGLGWIINSNNLFPDGNDALFGQSASSWGWFQLLLGAVVLLAGFAVFSGNVLARTVGVIAAIISVFSAFASMTFYPFWALTIIAIDVAIIWALTVHGRDIQKAQEMGGVGG
jgi:hypothetical protein